MDPAISVGPTTPPQYFFDAELAVLLDLVADMIERITTYNDQLPLLPESITRFHSRAPPAISVRDYLRRIARYANVEKCCLLMILIYIDRICMKGTNFVVSSLTVHRVIIAAIVVASKSLCDNYYTNVHYAKVGGISLNELNTLELEILFLLDWKLSGTPETLQHYYTNLVRNSQQYGAVAVAQNADIGTSSSSTTASTGATSLQIPHRQPSVHLESVHGSVAFAPSM